MKNLFKFSIIGFIFVSVFGSLCHFIFEWSGYSKAIAFFCPVNESVWEHLKILFFPYLIWGIIEFILMKKPRGFIASKYIGAFLGMTVTVTFFYTYTGIIGKSIELLNILSFFIGVFSAFAVDYILIKSSKLKPAFYDNIAIALFILTAVIFFCFTFVPPFIPLFKDPKSLNYGI
ncbi:MAG: DUF6512 family protein [Eubacterium sp.]